MKFEYTKFYSTLRNAQGSRSCEEFASQCKISYSTLMRLYQGATPSINTLQKIAQHAENHVTLEDLVSDAYSLHLPHHFRAKFSCMTLFSRRLHELREERSLSWDELASELNRLSECITKQFSKSFRPEGYISPLSHRYYSQNTLYSLEMEFEQPTISDLDIMSYFFDVSFDYLIGVTNIKTPRIDYVNNYSSINFSDAEIELEHLKNFHNLPEDIKNYIFTLSDTFTWKIEFEKELHHETESLHKREDIAMENLTPTLANDEDELLHSYRALNSKLKILLWDLLRAWEKGSNQSNSILQNNA